MKKISLEHEVPDYEKMVGHPAESPDVPKKKGFPTMYLSHESIPASAKPGDTVVLHGRVKEVSHRKTLKEDGEKPDNHSSMDVEVHHMEHTSARPTARIGNTDDDEQAIDAGLDAMSEKASAEERKAGHEGED